jgi:hypothetical protein
LIEAGDFGEAFRGGGTMKLPYENAGYQVVVKYARYVARRLRASGRLLLAAELQGEGLALRAKGRAWEDTEDALSDALADRDAADDTLDGAAQMARASLAGRSVSAAKEEPYTLIYGEGIGYYTAANLDQEVPRYGELVQRAATHLPESDGVRVQLQTSIPEGLAAFTAGVASLDAAETAQSLARTELERADRNLRRQLTKVYGVLVAEIGKASADRFFPKATRNKSEAAEG